MRNHQAARFEAALGILGMRIAHMSSAHAAEKAKAQPDQARLVTMEEAINQWTDEQEMLVPQEAARIEQLLAAAE